MTQPLGVQRLALHFDLLSETYGPREVAPFPPYSMDTVLKIRVQTLKPKDVSLVWGHMKERRTFSKEK